GGGCGGEQTCGRPGRARRTAARDHLIIAVACCVPRTNPKRRRESPRCRLTLLGGDFKINNRRSEPYHPSESLLMRRFTFPVSCWLSVALVAAGGVAGARAQDKKDRPKSERVHFETVDQVELNGTFWPSTKGRKAACVILLHKLNGKGSHEEGW